MSSTFVAVALALTLFLPAKENPPIRPNKDGITQNDNRGTKSTPLIVDVVKPPVDEEQTQKEKQKEAAEQSVKVWNIILTAIIAAATVTQCVIYSKQKGIADKTLILQFRPKIVVRGGGVNNGRVVFWITNTGGAKAHLITCKIRPTPMGTGGIYPDLLAGSDDLPPGTVFVGGQSVLLSIPLDDKLAALVAEQDNTVASLPGAIFTEKICCIGSIKYRDDIGTARMTGIFRRYAPGTSWFKTAEGNDLEYAD